MTGIKSFKNIYDVAVIGGGPVGSQMACKLAGLGYRVTVLEKKPEFTERICCTGIVSRECIETYQVPGNVIYRWAQGASLFSPLGSVISVRRDTPQAAILNRPAFNRLWAKRARDAGAEFLYEAEVKQINHSKSGVALSVVYRGNACNLQSRAVVMATGFGARLMDGLGLGVAGDFVMGAQAEVSTYSANEVEVYFGAKTAPGFFGWLAPTSKDKALVGVLSRRHPPAYLRSLLARLADEGKIVSKEVPFTYGGVALRPLHRTYGDRLLVVGTAAGQVKPLTGGGFYFGLLCADIAAGTLHRGLAAGDLSPSKLQGYERAWKRRLGKELQPGYFGRRIFELLSDRQLERVFKVLSDSGLIQDMEQSDELSFDWHAAVVNRVFNHRVILKIIRSLGARGKVSRGLTD